MYLENGLHFFLCYEERKTNKDEFVEDFFEFLGSEEIFLSKDMLTRENYVEIVEPYAKKLLSLIMGSTTKDKEQIMDFFSSVGMDLVETIKEEVNNGNYTNVFYLLGVVLTPPESLQEEALDGMITLINNSVAKVEKPDSLSDDDINTIKNSIRPLLKFLQPLIYHDFMGEYGEDDDGENYTLRIIASIIENFNLLIQPHRPDVILAWMRAMDTYYTTQGTISQKENAEDNYAEATLENIELSELESLLSEEEKELVEYGYDANIYLTVDKLNESEVTSKEKELINNVINTDSELGFYLDINLFKVIGNNDPVSISDLDSKIKITITIPEELKGMDSYKIIRIHNNKVDILDTEVDGDKLTFETDCFSTYALIYTKAGIDANENDDNNISINNGNKAKNTSPKTGDNILTWFVLFTISAIGIIKIIKQ